MTAGAEELDLYRCARNCGFATTEPYNFCPLCGSVLLLYTDGKLLGASISVNFEKSRCPVAWMCRLTDIYRPECEELKLTHQCVVAIMQK